MGRSSRILGESPRYCSCHDGLCSVKSLGVIFLPASSNATRMPAAVSFLAAHPPVAPEPTTIASNGSLGETICSMNPQYIASQSRTGILACPLQFLPAHSFPQRRDVCHVMPAVPGIQRKIRLQAHYTQLRMPELTGKIIQGERAQQQYPAHMQRFEQRE